MNSLSCICIEGKKHPWMVPLGTSHIKRNLEINDYNFSCKRQNFNHNGHMQLETL